MSGLSGEDLIEVLRGGRTKVRLTTRDGTTFHGSAGVIPLKPYGKGREAQDRIGLKAGCHVRHLIPQEVLSAEVL